MFKSYIKHRHFKHNTAGVSYTPKQLAAFYGFPKGFDGSGKHAAVIELGGSFSQPDLDKYFHSLGLTVKPVIFHSIDGAKNTPTVVNDADGEVMLDLCVIGGAAPGCQMHCYTALNTDASFLKAIEQATADKMDAISISWGADEAAWSAASRASFNAALQAAALAGITVTVASGDNGSADGGKGNNVDFPASSPWVLGCGGTSLPSLSPSGEVVWNDGTKGGATGGGVSVDFALPTFQASAGVAGGKFRGVPDVAAVADPETGWNVIVNSAAMVVGGTSAVAPFMAAMAVVLSQALGKNVGFLPPLLYAMEPNFRDITSGNNGTYIARVGYDSCTGLGAPVVDKILAALGSPAAPPLPPPVVPPPVTPAPPASATRNLTIIGASRIILDGNVV